MTALVVGWSLHIAQVLFPLLPGFVIGVYSWYRGDWAEYLGAMLGQVIMSPVLIVAWILWQDLDYCDVVPHLLATCR